MGAPVYNIEIEENSDFDLKLSITQFGVDLTLCEGSILFKIARSYSDSKAIDLSQYGSVSGNIVTINVPAEAIKTIPFDKGIYDVALSTSETNRKRILQGKVKVSKAVSK